jgi:hypothetical protein
VGVGKKLPRGSRSVEDVREGDLYDGQIEGNSLEGVEVKITRRLGRWLLALRD